jgi:hypothetical protein
MKLETFLLDDEVIANAAVAKESNSVSLHHDSFSNSLLLSGLQKSGFG